MTLSPVMPTALLTQSLKDMILIPSRYFNMGSENSEFQDASPLHKVWVDSFYVDQHEATNAEFATFIAATGYVTVAERKLYSKDFIGVPQELLVPGSLVFNPDAISATGFWWTYQPGACWHKPDGHSLLTSAMDSYPVVHVAHEDAQSYCQWRGKRLLTEAEWEYAARGEESGHYYWGDSILLGGKHQANLFQGDFPLADLAEDGYSGIAPIKSYNPDSRGIYDLTGNVWEWCSDLYDNRYYANSPIMNPKGPIICHDPTEPQVIKHVIRGGSFLCSASYCSRYLAGARNSCEINTSSNHLGVRCGRSVGN